MTVQTMQISQSLTPLMALADAALSDGESQSSSSLSQVERELAERQLITTLPMEKLTFAQQLMTLLDDEASPYLKWMPDGKSFTIKNPKKFTSDQMPKLFNIRNMSSFVRKLTRWGFARHHEKETMNSDIFKHASFEKGAWERCSEIKCATRQPVSSTLRKAVRKMTPIMPIPVAQSAPRPVSPVMSKTTTSAANPQQSPQSVQHWTPRSVMPHPTSVMPGRSTYAALTSMTMAPDLMKLAPTMRVNLLALQLLQEASQTQLNDQAFLQCLLARLPANGKLVSYGS
ncbi:MAG: hypothetical protein SGBAC_009985 [Bacillariaceae sp.]